MKTEGEIILYQSENSTQIEVRIEDETVWLSLAQMVDLFMSSKQNISLHINNVFKEGELNLMARFIKRHSTTSMLSFR